MLVISGASFDLKVRITYSKQYTTRLLLLPETTSIIYDITDNHNFDYISLSRTICEDCMYTKLSHFLKPTTSYHIRYDSDAS